MDKLGPEHVHVAKCFSNLSRTYQDFGDLEKAKGCQERAITITLDKLGPEHVDVATSYSNLATTYRALDELKQGKEYQQRALAIGLDKLGPGHVHLATNFNNLSLIYRGTLVISSKPSSISNVLWRLNWTSSTLNMLM